MRAHRWEKGVWKCECINKGKTEKGGIFFDINSPDFHMRHLFPAFSKCRNGVYRNQTIMSHLISISIYIFIFSSPIISPPILFHFRFHFLFLLVIYLYSNLAFSIFNTHTHSRKHMLSLYLSLLHAFSNPQTNTKHSDI